MDGVLVITSDTSDAIEFDVFYIAIVCFKTNAYKIIGDKILDIY